MRLCFLSRRYFPTVSGMSVYADNLVRQLVRQGHDVTMLSQYYGGATAGVYGGGSPPGIEGATVVGFESINEQACGDFESDIEVLACEVERRHAEQPFDVIHAQYGYPTGYAALVAARRLGLPCVVSIQGGDGHWVGSCCDTHRDAMRKVCRHADAVIIGSCGFAQSVGDRLDLDPDLFTVVPGAVDTTRFSPPAGRPRGWLGSPPHLLYHGRVDRRKGVFELLDAFDTLRAEGRNLRLTVSGIGPDYDAARERCEATAGCHASGYADYFAAPDLYRAADVFVSPSHAEGFSNTILEAMATGLPIVSCDAVGVRDCLAHERDGLLAEVGNAADLAEQIRRMLDDFELRASLATVALERVRDLYAWPRIAERIAAVYHRVVARPVDDAFEPLPTLDPPEPCRFRGEPHLL